MRNAGLDEVQVGIKIVGEISITSDMPGESQGWRSLVGCHLWGHTGSTKAT